MRQGVATLSSMLMSAYPERGFVPNLIMYFKLFADYHRNQELFYPLKFALAPGGVVEALDKTTMHPDNEELCHTVVSAFGANVLGIDAILKRVLKFRIKSKELFFSRLIQGHI